MLRRTRYLLPLAMMLAALIGAAGRSVVWWLVPLLGLAGLGLDALLLRISEERLRNVADQVVICNGFFIKADRSSDLPTVLDVLAAPSGAYNRSTFSAEARGEIRETTVQEVGG